MIVIRNRLIPFGRGMIAINLFGIIFAKQPLSRRSMNHEYIHTLQQRELLFVGFFVLYVLEWLYHLIRTRNWLKAYYSISFEREAYSKEILLNYRKLRRPYAWIAYLSFRNRF